ncbi:MAG TPA: riboflavin biosynthesis protein RibF [Tepidisphaeraceae bacterium]|jgi:riboflavin kinase/FMN adenylyltransferase
MQRLTGIDGLCSLPPGVVLSVGNYDGVHAGHEAILRAMRDDAGSGPLAIPIAVVTFEPHPLTVLRPSLVPPRLTPLPMKMRLLAERGVDYLVTLPPTPEVLGLTAVAFWELLRDRVRPSRIVEGQSFNFGRDRGGTIEKLIEWSAGTDIVVERRPAHAVRLGGVDVAVSSSVVRSLLLEGRVEDAARCLGRAYELEGQVVQGFQRGRTIGVPTANLDGGEQLVPAEGVYAGRVSLSGRTYAAAVSIGTTPTFEQRRAQVEVHIIDFSGDLYGKPLAVSMLSRLRDQERFSSVDALKTQLSQDILAARRIGLAEPSGA